MAYTLPPPLSALLFSTCVLLFISQPLSSIKIASPFHPCLSFSPIILHFSFPYLPQYPIRLLLLCPVHRENKGSNSIGSRLKSLSYLDDDEDVFEKADISPRTRTLPARSYTIDTPYTSSESPEPFHKEDQPPAASPATGRAASPLTSRGSNILDSPAGSDTTTIITPTSYSSFHRSQSPEAAPLPRKPVSEDTNKVKTTTVFPSSSSVQEVPKPRRPLLAKQAEVESEVKAPSSGSLYKQQPQLSSMEPKPPAVSRVSASLPRSYQRSDSARLTSVVTPRPFGTQPSRLSSLPRVLPVSTR